MWRAQFYRLFLAPDVRAHFIEYDALAILDWDIVATQEASFDRLYWTTFTATEPFWVKGSSHTGICSEDEAASGMGHLLDYPVRNAIYNNSDIDFFRLINFTMEWRQSTSP